MTKETLESKSEDLKPLPDSLGSSDCGVHPDYKPLEGGQSFSNLISKLLRKPLAILYELESKKASWRIPVTLLLISMVSLSVFGFVVGTFAGGDQFWAAPLKIVFGLMFSAAICLPSLYIFACIGGLDAKFSSVLGLLCSLMALSGLMLVGFAPVVWLFSVSSTSVVFLGFILVVLWLISAGFGFSLVFRAGRAMGMTNTGHLFVWCLIFLLVTIQMTTTLRPVVGESEMLFNFSEKKFFLEYWSEQMR
jgi:hypothetical protein